MSADVKGVSWQALHSAAHTSFRVDTANDRGANHAVRVAIPGLLLAISSCSLGDWAPPEQREPIDVQDNRTFRGIELTVEDDADFEALAAQELTFQGPVTDATGRRYITMYTTGAHASSLAAFGFRARGYAEPTAAESDGSILFGPSCTWTTCSDTPPSSYFISYDDIVAELQDMDAVSDAVTLVELGDPTYENRHIVGVQFGPLEAGDPNPPTLYLLATYHAREWLSTGVALQLARWLYELVTQYTIDGTADLPLAGALVDHAMATSTHGIDRTVIVFGAETAT